MTSTLRFLGAAGTVTGSRFLVDTGSARVLVDCGSFQGRKDLRLRNWAPFPVDPASIDAVVLTHAHLDHVGHLPVLVRDGFRGTTWCSPSTAELAAIVLRDSAHLHEEEAEYANRKGFSKHQPALPLYTAADAEAAIATLRPIQFHAAGAIATDVEVTLRPAGHILGSATASLQIGGGARRLLFTGDLGRTDHPLLCPPDDPPPADVVVTESTYGNRSHTPLGEGLDQLAETVVAAVARGGKVIIPAFAVDRTEVVLLALAELVREGRIPRLPIHVDSPMALAVLDVYRQAIDDGAGDVRVGVSARAFDGCGSLHEVRSVEESRALGDLAYPAVIISASGMATGGRVLHHLARSLPDPRNAVLLAGFQAPGTRGRLLADGASTIRMLGRDVPVRCSVAQIDAFSTHADADGLLGWLGRVPGRPQSVFTVHGEPDPLEALSGRIRSELHWPVAIPRQGERFPIG